MVDSGGFVLLKRLASIFCVCAMSFSTTSQAREYHDLFSTPMGLSMGGAISSFVDDWNSIYYNPAGLAKMQDFSMRMPDIIHGEISAGVLEIFEKIQDLDSSEPIAQQLKSFDGRTGSLRVSPLGFGVFFKKVGLALNVADVKTSIRIQVPTVVFARAFYDSRVDSGLSAGYGHSFVQDKVRVGFALRLLGRAGSSGYLEGQEITEAAESLGERAGAGFGVDADLGFQGNLDPIKVYGISLKPMAGIVFQNILATKYNLIRFKQEEFKGSPPPNERRINAGVSVRAEGIGPFSVTPSFEFRDLLIDTDSFWEYVSTGVQFGLHGGYWFNGFIRTAYHKGAFAAGLGGNLGPAELEIGTYSVGLGEAFGVGRDRRFYTRLALNW
jgi:hypothetical protein